MLVNVSLGKNVLIHHPDLVNLYGCTIGDNCKIATFVEIQKGVVIGSNCKIEAFSFICTGVTVGNGVFVGPSVTFTNDLSPKAVDKNMSLLTEDEWEVIPTTVEDKVSIGAGAVILCGTVLGEGSMVAAGSVVTKDVPQNCLVAGCPAKVVKANINLE